MMRKGLLSCVLMLALAISPALAEVYEGVTIAADAVPVEAVSGGVLEALSVWPGHFVAEGETIGAVRTTRVFAAQDGTVAKISAEEGEEVQGTVLEIAPFERYTIYCTVEKAYQDPEMTLVHSGEQLYMKCTANGTHRGVGVVTEIDGETFDVLCIGGELYVGETVYLYRDEEFSKKQRVGIGTVVRSDTQVYEEEGTVVRVHVAEGEDVERGELLYEMADAAECTLTAPTAGIVSEVTVSAGDRIDKEQVIARIVPLEQIWVEIQVDEEAAARMAEGDPAMLTYAADPTETPAEGSIRRILNIPEEGLYTVVIEPEDRAGLRLGQSVAVRIGQE